MEKEHVEWDPADFLSKAVKWEMSENKDLSYSQALMKAQEKYPGMAQRYMDQMQGKWPPSNWTIVEGITDNARVDSNNKDVDPGDLLIQLTKDKMEKKDLSYSMAFAEVQRENPELAKRHLDQMRAKI
jgi:hypothetical protein